MILFQDFLRVSDESHGGVNISNAGSVNTVRAAITKKLL